MNNLKIGSLKSSKPIRDIFAEQLRRGQSVRMTIKGRSMSPFIKRSDIIIVKPIKFDQAKIGDIIACTRSVEHGFTAHRLIRKRKDAQGREFLFTKGDVSIHGDFPVYPEDIYGKVITIERNTKVINLETRFRCFLGYLIAYLSYGLALGQEMVFQPHLFSIKIWRKVKR
jgi:signal peptidase I